MTTVIASRPHYAAHLAPITNLLSPDLDVALVASYHDLCAARRAGHRRIVLAQHGAGQSYGGDRRSTHNPAYPGGADNAAAGLFLVPNDHAAARWRAAYPRASVAVVGSPRLDVLPARESGPGPVIATAFHWECRVCPEARSALAWHRPGLRRVAGQFTTIGHGHPRRRDLDALYAGLGVERVADFDEVCRRADVFVCDNSSALFEFAATGRPVVILNAPHYRREVRHGLRFWDAATVGVQVDNPADLPAAIERALELRPEDVAAREHALGLVYAYRSGAAERAARAIEEWSCAS